MFCIFKDHINRFVLQYDFLQSHDILMSYFSIQLFNQKCQTSEMDGYREQAHGNLPNSTLANPSIRQDLTLFFRLEFLDRKHLCVSRRRVLGVLTRILAVRIPFSRLINASIGSGRDETMNGVFGLDGCSSCVLTEAPGGHLICLRRDWTSSHIQSSLKRRKEWLG
jgi:hypothetical protein